MTTLMVDSARKWILAGLVVGVLGAAAVAADPCSDGNCGKDWFDSNSCSNCIGDLDTTCCGDMSPFAMCPGGRWYFRADLMAIRRSAAQDEVFQTRNTNTLTSEEVLDVDGASLDPRVFNLVSTIDRETVLSTDDLDFQFAAGYRLLFGCKLADSYAFELSYFDLNDWNETAAVSDAITYDVDGTIDVTSGVVTVTTTQPNSLFSPFTNFGDSSYDSQMLLDFDYNNLATISCRSSLDNVEMNVRHWLTDEPSRMAISVLWGGRYNAIREDFRYYTSAANLTTPTTNTVNLHTKNDLWAAQIGTQIDFCWDPGWHTELELKGGVAHNRAVYEGTYNIQDGAGGGLQNYTGRVDKDVTSWIGEMRLTLVYQFGSHLTTHVGYEALVLSKVALASRNFETDLSILAGGPWTLNNGGSVIYHGPSAGFTFAW